VVSGDPRTIGSEQLGEHVWRVTTPGELDLADAPLLRDKIDRIYDAGSAIALDLTETTFIDSSIVGVIVYAADRSREAEEHRLVVIAPPGSHPRRVLDMVSAGGLVTVVDNLRAALDSIAAGPRRSGSERVPDEPS